MQVSLNVLQVIRLAVEVCSEKWWEVNIRTRGNGGNGINGGNGCNGSHGSNDSSIDEQVRVMALVEVWSVARLRKWQEGGGARGQVLLLLSALATVGIGMHICWICRL